MSLKLIQPIHPFPARMASEIALDEVSSLPRNSVVLDPMAGSGTVLRAASEAGHRALGFDLDPLAVLMAKVWTTPIDTDVLRANASELIMNCRAQDPSRVTLPWIDEDPETSSFIDYWFAPRQQAELRCLALGLNDMTNPIGNALRLAVSRIIVTKEKGASLARDVSHSRPHRVRITNEFPVFEEFERAVKRIVTRLEREPPVGNVDVRVGDARRLEAIPTASIDSVITSPPYLNAIDYLRGHRLALVWLGFQVATLRAVRAVSIGAERRPDDGADGPLARELIVPLGPISELPSPVQRMIDRYVLDLYELMSETYRVLRPGGRAVFVVGNSCLRGVYIRNASVISTIARRLGLQVVNEVERELPPNRRYLPPPQTDRPSNLEKRMRTETVLTFERTL